MRVTIVGPTYPHRGGIVHYTNSLASALQRTGRAEVVIESFSQMFPAVLYKGSTYHATQSFPLPREIKLHKELTYWNPLSWLRAGRRTKATDLLHFQVWTPFLAPAYRGILLTADKVGENAIATIHNVVPHEARDRRLGFLNHSFLRKMRAVVVHSEALVNPLVEISKVNKDRIHVIPQGIYRQFGRPTADRHLARERLGLAPTDRVAIAFGLIRPYKGLDTALRALALLEPHHKLIVVGESWESWSRYRRIIEELGLEERVRTELRYIPDDEVAEFFAASDVALFPYRSFGSQSAAALTAIGFGLPIVVSNVGGLADLAPSEFVVPPDDHSALAVAWQGAAECPKNGSRVRATDWDQVATQTQQLYEDTLVGRT